MAKFVDAFVRTGWSARDENVRVTWRRVRRVASARSDSARRPPFLLIGQPVTELEQPDVATQALCASEEIRLIGSFVENSERAWGHGREPV